MPDPTAFSATLSGQWSGPPKPTADELDAASAVLNDVLECTGTLQDDLHLIASRHVSGAPASSVRVLDLSAALARTVLDWIGRWPT